MEVNFGETQIVELQETYSLEQIQGMALSKRIDAFGQMAKLLQRPKPEDIIIETIQKQYEPFWYVSAIGHYIYERKHVYHINTSSEVQVLIIDNKEYSVSQNRSHGVDLDTIERCEETLQSSLTLDGQTGEKVDFYKYLTLPQVAIPDVSVLQQDNVTVLMPEIRSSFVVRKIIPTLMKTFQADKILKESINVETLTLCFRPVYAVQYSWPTKQKQQVLIFDALSGNSKAVSGELKKQVFKILDNDTLFDIGADVIGSVIPGANVAIKIGRLAARKAINTN